MSHKRFLAVLSRYLWPVDDGRKESLNCYFRELHDKHGYEICILCFLEYGQKVNEKDFPYYISSVTVLNDTPIIEKIKNVLVYSFGAARWPFQCALYYNVENRKIIEGVIAGWKPDVIFAEMIRTCIYYDAFKNSGALLLANLDDLLSKRYLRQSRSGKSKANFAGKYGNKMPKIMSGLMNGNLIRGNILRMEARRCQKWERIFYNQYDYTLLTSDVECNAINSVMNSDKAKTLSVGIDYDYYSQDLEMVKEPNGLSYLGNFNVATNADTLDMIANEILPYIKSDYRFYIIGKCPDKIKDKYSGQKNFVFCGRVDDLRKWVKKTAIFLSPIAYGTGVKTKIIEAMAMNMLVITNSVGAEGINAESGRDYIVLDDMKEIAKAVDKMLADPDRAKQIGMNAGKFAYEHFRWEKVLAVYEEIGI